MTRLYIIGNGFDLHHNVRSSYKDFANWLRKHDYKIFDTYRKVCDYEALWQDFERSMAYVNRNYFLDRAMRFLPSLKGREEDDLTMSEIYLAGDWGADYAEQLVDRLKHRFSQWVDSIKIPTDYKSHQIPIDVEARFLTFNYTNFLESQYGIEESKIRHIHGKRGNPNDLIVGHGEDALRIFDNWFKKIRESRPILKNGKKIYIPSPYLKLYKEPTCYLPEYQYLTERIESYYKESEKPVDKIIKSQTDYFKSLHEIKFIEVLGFSFSDVDMPYLQTIVSNNDHPYEIKWRVSQYTDRDKIKSTNALKNIGVDTSNIEFFKM